MPEDTTVGLVPTPGQTVGPFFGYALPVEGGGEVVPAAHPQAVRLHGTVRDGAGDPVPDALLETWQAAPDGSFPAEQGSLRRGHAFTGFGRVAVDAGGRYELTTVVPGGPAPYVAITLFARGLLDRLFTRAYLPVVPLDDEPFLAGVPEQRRHTLVAVPDDLGFRFDITLQGDDETVFLAFPRHGHVG